MNLEELEHRVYYLMKAHKVLETLNQSFQIKGKQILHELCDLSSVGQARIASKEEAKRNHSETQSKTLSRSSDCKSDDGNTNQAAKAKGKVFANLKLSKTKPYETKLRNQAIQSSNHEKQVTRQVEKRRESHSKGFRRPIWSKMNFTGSARVAFSNSALTRRDL